MRARSLPNALICAGLLIGCAGGGVEAVAVELDERWSHNFGSPVSASPALLPEGGPMVGSRGNPDPNHSVLPNIGGLLRAFTPGGQLAWSVAPFGGVGATVAVTDDGTVLVASLGSLGQGSRQVAYRRGTELWSGSHERTMEHAPAVAADGTVLFVTGNRTLRALRPGGAVAWELPGTSWSALLSEPTIAADGTIYLGAALGYDRGHLRAISPEGATRWTTEIVSPLSVPTVGADGTVYIPGGTARVAGKPAWDTATPPHVRPGLHAVNPDGSLRWFCQTTDVSQDAPVLAPDGTLYVGDVSGRLHAISRAGQRLWVYDGGAPIVASAAVAADGTLYFGTTDGRFQAVHADGTAKAERTLDGEIRSSPVIGSDGTVYVTTVTGTLHALRGSAGPADSPAPFAGRNAQRDGRDRTVDVPEVPADLTVNPDPDGKNLVLTWQPSAGQVTYEVRRSETERVDDGESPGRFLAEPRFVDVNPVAGRSVSYWVRARNSRGVSAWSSRLKTSLPVAEPGGLVWQHRLAASETATSIALDKAGRFYAATSNRRLLCFSEPGHLAWAVPTPSDIQTAPVIDAAGQVFVAIDGREPGSGIQMAAWNPDGTPAWRLYDLTSLPPAVASNGDILIASFLGFVRRWSTAGAMPWETRNLYSVGAPSIRGDGRVYLSGSWALDPEGTPVWNHRGPGGGTTAAIGRDGTLYFGIVDASGDLPVQSGSFLAVGTDGGIRWSYPSGPITSSPAILPDDSLVVGTLAGTVLRVNSSGAKVWEFDTGAPVESSPAVTADGVVWCGSNNGRLYALNGDGTVRWQWELGTAVRSSPAVGPDGLVYVAADGGGVFVVQGGAPPADSPWPMHRHDAQRTGRNTVTPVPPGIPGDVTAIEADERGALTVTWSSSPWAETYEVWRGTTDVAEDMVRIAENVSGQNRWTDRDADCRRTYYYRVRARNPLGFGPLSAPGSGFQTSRLWQIAFTNYIAGAPALASDGSVRVVLNSTTHGLAALNPDGSVRWRAPVGRPLPSLVVGPDGTTYIGSYPREVMAVSPSGEIRWRTLVDGTLTLPSTSEQEGGFALTSDGLLLVPSEPSGLYVLGTDGESRVFTSVPAGGVSAPVVASDGSIFLTSRDLSATLLDRMGQLQWRANKLYLTSAAIAPDGNLIGVDARRVVSLSPTGRTNWLASLGGVVGSMGTPVIAPDGSVYVANGSQLFALNPDGSTRWVTNTPAYHPLLLDDGTTVTRRGSLLGIRGAGGTLLWSAVVGNSANAVVVDAEGAIYATGPSNLCKFAGTHGPPLVGWPMRRLNAAGTASLAQSAPDPAPHPVREPSATTGQRVGEVQVSWASDPQFAWVEVWRGTGTDPAAAERIGRALPGGFSFVDPTALPGHLFHYWLRATNAAGGTPLIGPVQGFATPDTDLLWKYEPANEFTLSTVARGPERQFYTCTGNGRLLALTPAGELAWSFEGLPGPLSDPVVGPDGTIFTYHYDQLAAVNPDGTLKWKRSIPTGTGALAVTREGTVVLAQRPYPLVAYSPDGTERWTTAPVEGSISTPAIGVDGRFNVIAGDLLTFTIDGSLASRRVIEDNVWQTLAASAAGPLYLGGYPKALVRVDPDGVQRFSVLDGERIMSREPCLGPDGSAFVLTSNRRVTAVDAAGQVKWDYPAYGGAIVAEASGGLLVIHSNLVVALDARGAERWVYPFERPIPANAAPTSPLLTRDGILAFTSGKRLIVLRTTMTPAATGWAMHRADPARSGCASVALEIESFKPTPAGDWVLTVRGVRGSPCLLEESADLVIWSTVASVPGNAPTLTIPVPSHPGPVPRFYRVRSDQDAIPPKTPDNL